MTFSTRSIIDLVNQSFVPVWESVAPVTVATFDLGDGKELSGTVGGEIALYFCRPDGKVFDVLPALQSPAATRLAMVEALDFYRRTGADARSVQDYHRRKRNEGWQPDGALTWRDFPHKKRIEFLRENADPATEKLGTMVGSKVAIINHQEPVLVVEPGGRELYEQHIHRRFAQSNTLGTPSAWKRFLFEEVMGQRLEGGKFRFDSRSLTPMSVTQ